MSLPRTFVGFSSTDLHCYRLMTAWKAHEHIDFEFCDCQLAHELNSQSEDYIKQQCRARIKMAGHYVLLIGQDTRSKHKYVRWEAEVAVEKGCTIIGVNLDKTRFLDQARTPTVIQNIGALFVTFSPPILAYALRHYKMNDSKNYHYPESVYQKLGYIIDGRRAYRPKPPLPAGFR
jgi:hypothetical protein